MRTAHSDPPVLLWFRQDLRLDDQAALQAAVAIRALDAYRNVTAATR